MPLVIKNEQNTPAVRTVNPTLITVLITNITTSIKINFY